MELNFSSVHLAWKVIRYVQYVCFIYFIVLLAAWLPTVRLDTMFSI